MTSAVQVVDERRVAEKVRLELTSVFNERLVASTFVSPLGIGFVVWLQTVAVGSQQALVWGALIVFVELLIIGFGRAFCKALLDDHSIAPWVYAQLICCGLLGLLWGAATWFVWEPNHFLFYVTTLCVLVGVSFICMVVMAPMSWAMVSFSAGLMVFPLVQLAVIENPVGREIGVGWVVMVVVQMRYSQGLRKELIRQIDSSVRNVILVDRLTEVGRELTLANSDKEAQNAALNVAMEQLNRLVTFDQLTGAYSRRHFMEELERQIALSARHASPVSLIMLDLDHFKAINDRHGHAVGDHVLREVALNAKSQLREGDMLGRIGGEEFLVLLPMTNQEAAVILAERLRVSLAAIVLEVDNQTISITSSLGVAELHRNEDTASWLRRVDEALYQAKTAGRNQVVAAT